MNIKHIKDMKAPAIRQALVELIEMGLVRDSGRRRNGKIVWVAVKGVDAEAMLTERKKRDSIKH